MNKKKFISEVSKKLKINEKDTNIINEIFENNFLIGKKNKDNIVKTISKKLNIDMEKANDYYNGAVDILKNELKDKLKNPFKSQD